MYNVNTASRRTFLARLTTLTGGIFLAGIALTGCGTDASSNSSGGPPPTSGPLLYSQVASRLAQAGIAVTSVQPNLGSTSLTAAQVAAQFAANPNNVLIPVQTSSGTYTAQTAASLGISSATLQALFTQYLSTLSSGDQVGTVAYTIGGTTYNSPGVANPDGTVKFDPLLTFQLGKVTQTTANQNGLNRSQTLTVLNDYDARTLATVTFNATATQGSNGGPTGGTASFATALSPGVSFSNTVISPPVITRSVGGTVTLTGSGDLSMQVGGVTAWTLAKQFSVSLLVSGSGGATQ